MLRLYQIIIPSADKLQFDAEGWSNNILLSGQVVAHEVTIRSPEGNKFLINKALDYDPTLNGDKEQMLTVGTMTLDSVGIQVPAPLVLYAHQKHIYSIRIHKDNVYGPSTVINALVSTDGKNLDELINDIEDAIKKVRFVYGEEYYDEYEQFNTFDLGDRLRGFENILVPSEWEKLNPNQNIEDVIGEWATTYTPGLKPTPTVASKILNLEQALSWDDTYLN